MSLYFVFTVDGDWDEYFAADLGDHERWPYKPGMVYLIRREMEIADELLGGRFVHFIHTSPRVRDVFFRPVFISLWQQIEKNNGSIGIHCHEDDPGLSYHFDDEHRMRDAIEFSSVILRANGLQPNCFRGGYMSFSPKTIVILEKDQIDFDFSCDPGRHLLHDGKLVSDWRGAPDNFYHLDYVDHRRPGTSRVIEIPLGVYLDHSSLWQIWQAARQLKKKKGLRVVSVLSHSYEFGSAAKRLKIKLALSILKKYGKFINIEELKEIIKKES